MITHWILSIMVGAVIGHLIARFSIKRKRRKKLAALDLLELSLPAEVPSTCPKCGYAGREAKTGEPYAFPAQSTFRKPHHMERLVSVDSPEHLSHPCYKCQFRFRTAAREA